MELTEHQQLEFIRKHFLTNAPIDNSLTVSMQQSNTDILPMRQSSIISKTDTNDNIDTDIIGYRYLDDVVLSNSLVLFPRNLTEKYTIHLCLFSINTDLRRPFLQFMFSKAETVYEFPHMDLNMENIQESVSPSIMPPAHPGDSDIDSDSDADSVSGVDAEFFTQCSELFEKTITIDDIDIHSLYRGFLEDDQDNTQLYVFFDCTGLHIEVHNDEFSTGEKIMGIVDNLNRGNINNVEIKQPIVDLFNQNMFAKTLNTDDGKIINHPITAYICSNVDGDNMDNAWVNEYYTDEHGYNDVSLLTSTVNHKRYHDIYMFSKSPINGEYNNITRFALFYEEIHDNNENIAIVNIDDDESGESGESGESSENDDHDDESGESNENNDDNESGEHDDDESGESGEHDDDESGESSEHDDDESSESDDDESGESSESDDDESGESSESDDDESGESSESDDDESGESSEHDDDESGESSESDDESTENVELEENVVFTFQEDGKIYYGTYSMETFTEL